MWVGGRSLRSLRRAVALADGWIPFGRSVTEFAAMLAAVRLPEGFEVALPCGPLDPGGAPDDTVRRMTALRDAGATSATCAIVADSGTHYRDQLHALRALAPEGVGP